MGDDSWEERELWDTCQNDEDLYLECERLNGNCTEEEADEFWERVRDTNLGYSTPEQLRNNKTSSEDFDWAIKSLTRQLVAGELGDD